MFLECERVRVCFNLTKIFLAIIFKFLEQMGKQHNNENQDPQGPYFPEARPHQGQVKDILIEKTFEGVKNTSAPLSRRPQLVSRTTAPKIQKQRKTRVYNPDDRFSNAHIKRYYLFPFYYSTLFPYFKISWKVWKPNSVYKFMAKFLSNIPGEPDKTPVQCKSFDQRMKDQHYVSASDHERMDLFETAFAYLKEEKLNREEGSIIKKYVKKMEEKSVFMAFMQDESQSESEAREDQETQKSSDPFITYQKKEDTSIPQREGELIFNQFLDIQK